MTKPKKMNEKEMIMLFLTTDVDLDKVDDFIANNGIDALDRDGRSLIFSAIVEKQIKVVEHLIEKGCALNLQDKEGFSPLHFAVIHDQPEMAALLIEKGANPNLTDKWGHTPLARAKSTKLDHQAELIVLLSS